MISLMFITGIVAIAGLIGLAQIRNQVTQELGDLAVALDNLDQSFHYQIGLDTDGDGIYDYFINSSYADPSPTLFDSAGSSPAGLMLNVPPPPSEGAPIPPSSGEFP